MQKKILIIGVGPVGLSTAIGFAHAGHELICYDIDKERIDALKNGIAPFYERDLQYTLSMHADKILFTDNLKEAFQDSNIFFICVGTPIGHNNSVDMTAIWNSIDIIAKNVKHDSTIVIKSTVPIGTNKKVVHYIDKLGLKYKIGVVSNPEFLAQGTSIQDTIKATRIVIGCNTPQLRELMLNIYDKFSGEKIVTTPESAELIKYESNCYLAMRVSFVNDLAHVCDLVGADVTSVLKGVTLDPRIGTRYFEPGLGYGGSCFPKDTICFHNQIQSEYGYEQELIEATIDINSRHVLRLCRKMMDNCGGSIMNKKVSVLGMSFKKDTDDVRNSLAVNIVSYLISNGAIVSVWDLKAMENAKKIFQDSVIYANSLDEAIAASDIIFIATDWNEIVDGPLDRFCNKSVYDGRNCFLNRKEEITFNYYYVGGTISEK
ncbi:MAG: UDP-glucose/GDP-mannose dehydrogenase family protein [Clostridia bacterium]|nr:UDP-glucose/GDP-mannose dehydrogenase family protein [Clostridia bacterium]